MCTLRLSWLLTACLALLAAPAFSADGGSTPEPPHPAASTPCAEGNLLAERAPQSNNAVRKIGRLNDDKIYRDGSPWDGGRSAIFDGPEAQVTWDLGRETPIVSLLVQADNNDTYIVSGSTDGQTFTPIWTVPKHPKAGLRTRLQQGLDARARYLRVEQPSGDDAFSLGEIQAWCRHPALWPPALTIDDAPKGKKKKRSASRKLRLARYKMAAGGLGGLALLALMASGRIRRWRWVAIGGVLGALGVAIGAAAREHGRVESAWVILPISVAAIVIGWLILRRGGGDSDDDGDGGVPRGLERMLLISLLFVSGFSWINYGTFHGSRTIHYWDSFHYYMGGKYFPENRYENIYQCTAIAELDDGRRSTFSNRQIRDLRDNSLGPAKPHLDRDAPCRAAFSDARWAEYRQESRLFRSYMGNAWWAKMFKDHGFNASPVWIMAGHVLTHVGGGDVPPPELARTRTNLKQAKGPRRAEIKARFQADRAAFELRIGLYAGLDGLLYAGCFVMIWWAFGLRACTLAMLVWGAGYPWAYFWTGGSFGRVPWLFMSTAGMCLMARGYKMLGGAGVTWAMLLRVFPGALIGGVSAKIAYNVLRHRTVSPGHRKVIFGCALALVVLVGASLPVVGGFDAYREFIGNSMKHKGTPLTNHMGLPTLLSYHPAYVARHTRNNDLDDPFAVWKEKRQKTLHDRRVLHYTILLGFLGLLGYLGRRLADWELTALSTVLIIGLFELTCYYYSFVIMLAPLAIKRLRYTLALLAMTLATQWGQMLRGWYDEQYTLESAFVLGGILYIAIDLAVRHRRLDAAGDAPPAVDAPDPLPHRGVTERLLAPEKS